RGALFVVLVARLSERRRIPRDPGRAYVAAARHSWTGRHLMENYVIAMAVSAGIYALMALGVNVMWGFAGMVNLGLVGFFAVGAYVSALTTTKLGWSMASGMLSAAALAAAVGVVVSLVTVRLRGDYLAIVTLGFAETIRIVASNA